MKSAEAVIGNHYPKQSNRVEHDGKEPELLASGDWDCNGNKTSVAMKFRA
jgi:hypothetical protein